MHQTAGETSRQTEGITTVPRARSVRTYMVGLATDMGPRMLAFRSSHLLIGRLPDNHLSLNHSSVSRRHARISVTPKGVTIEDLGSQNGTTVNGNRVEGEVAVRPGDVIRVGYVTVFYFGFVQPEEPPQIELIEAGVAITPTVALL